MPFTAAHPAIVLPLLRRRWLSATALIMGSMAPDFEYFFRLRTQSEVSHTLPGLLLFNLPVAVLLSLLFHTVVREQAVRYLPPYFRRRALAADYPISWLQYLRRNWLLVSLSAVAGAFSHLFWDSFTHNDGFFVELLPVLLTPVRLPVIGLSMELCRVIQHAGTLLGFIAIFWYIHLLPAQPLYTLRKRPWISFWLTIFVSGFLFLLFNLLVRERLEEVYKHLVVTLISGWMLALFFSGLAAKLLRQVR